jgi:hypothetical protein
MKRVMLISSWYDEIVEKRHTVMATSPLLKPYFLIHSNASSYPFSKVSVDELYNRISTDINNNHPDIILLHTGAAFCMQPEVFKICFQKLKKEYSKIRFGIEPGNISEEEISSLKIFDNSPEMKNIEDLFFKTIYGII